jgi:carbon starvation protein CstA
MARCIKSEKMGRPIFYGAMITEGLVALVWAAVSSYFFFDGGAAQVGSDLTAAAPTVVTKVSRAWLGVLGGILAVLGVVAAPITSGDTALRSARLIIAETLKYDQRSIGSRLAISVPVFLVTALLLWFNISDQDGFNTIWRYFGWANQTLACFALWAATAWLTINRGKLYYLITMLPAAFMTSVTVTYICVDKIGFRLPQDWIPYIGVGVFVLAVALYYIIAGRRKS